MIISKKELNEANGVDHQYHSTVTAWLSQYVHTLPMSLHQLLAFKAGTPDALRACSIPIQYATGFLAKAIVEMVESFPHSNMEINVAHQQIFDNWCGLVRTGVNLSEGGSFEA